MNLKKSMIGIYKITSPTGKIYIGQSWEIETRWKRHIWGSDNINLSNSLKEYGANDHEFKMIMELPKDIDQEVMNNMERACIELYRDCGIELMNQRMNRSNGLHATPMPEEVRSKISNALKNRKHSDEHKRRNSESKKGCKCYMYRIDSSKHPQAKKVICNKTGKIYGSIKEAADEIGMTKEYLGKKLNNRIVNKTSLSYVVFT